VVPESPPIGAPNPFRQAHNLSAVDLLLKSPVREEPVHERLLLLSEAIRAENLPVRTGATRSEFWAGLGGEGSSSHRAENTAQKRQETMLSEWPPTAWASCDGFHDASMMMTRFADTRFTPRQPARVEMR